ncbi:MAG: hypothetical protein ACXVEE_06800 [Polyangiales bacterium]
MTEKPVIERAYWVLAPEAGVRVEAPRWEAQAQKFFGVTLEIRGDTIRVADQDVRVRTWPAESCVAVIDAARLASASMGGFDVLVARTKSVLEIDTSMSRKNALLVAAIAASIVLGPILAPDRALLGVKSARERLAHFGQE